MTRAVRSIPLTKDIASIEKDDVISNVCLYLCEHQDVAKDIYEGKKASSLYQLAKFEIYELRSKMFFNNKAELSQYQRIMAVCEQYRIDPIQKNAYKIAAILNDRNFSISGVAALLSNDTPLHKGYSRWEESLDALRDKEIEDKNQK